MSDEAPEKESKTEDPSEKRLRDAHERGDVVKSQEVSTWFILSGSTLLLAILASPLAQGLAEPLRILIDQADRFDVGGPALTDFWQRLMGAILLVALVPSAVLLVMGIAGNLIQHRPVLSLDPIKPKFSKVNPIEGAKRLFSKDSLVNFVKGLVKLAVVAAAMWFVIAPELDSFTLMTGMAPATILEESLALTIKTFGAVVAAMTLIAGLDYFYQRQRWWNRLKMTIEEAKMEFKNQEGNPEIKGRMKRIRRERSKRRMMNAVPDATVVVMNPTHFAVALFYDNTMPAPKCVAKGLDAVALRIRALAEDSGVPVIENPPLARALFKAVEIDETIPAEHFKAVAEVIGFVYRLKRTRRWRPAA